MPHNERTAPPELRRLDPLLGTWTTRERTQDTELLGPGVAVHSRERFSWLEGGYFLVSTYETVFGDEPAQIGVNYWYYDAAAQRFRIIFFSNSPFTEDGNRYEGEVAGGKLTFTGPARFQYRLDEDGRIAVNPDGTISVAWWLRDGSGRWQPWMTNSFTRERD